MELNDGSLRLRLKAVRGVSREQLLTTELNGVFCGWTRGEAEEAIRRWYPSVKDSEKWVLCRVEVC